MQVDWFTFAAQIVNFLVLVWLLKRFLYRPILAAMEKRRKNIAARFEEAARKKQQAEEEQHRYQSLQDELKKTKDTELAKARNEAEQLRNSLVKEARQESDDARKQWLQSVEKEKTAFLNKTSRTIADQFEKLSRAALRDLADTELEAKIVDRFCREMERKSDVAADMKKAAAGEAFRIISSFELQEDQRQRIKQTLRDAAGIEHEPVFVRDEKVIAGIAVEAGGKKISWNLDRYLEEFFDELADTLERVQMT